SVCFAKSADSSDNAIFANALAWFSTLLEPQPRPTMLMIEAMLPPEAMKGATSRMARDRLAGLHGIARAVAHLRGVYDIATVSVGDVRGHFIGQRGLKREAAKGAVIERCRALGWIAADDEDADAADALATWSFACGIVRPETALRVSPLFNPKLRIVAQ